MLRNFINSEDFPDIMLAVALISACVGIYFQSYVSFPIVIICGLRGIFAHLSRTPSNDGW
jgi:hypothetical protein